MLQMAINKRLSTEVYLGALQGEHVDIFTSEIMKCVGFFTKSLDAFLKIHQILLKILSYL